MEASGLDSSSRSSTPTSVMQPLSTVIGVREEVLACLRIQHFARRMLTGGNGNNSMTSNNGDDCNDCDDCDEYDEYDDEDECSVCLELLCEPVRWPTADTSCKHVFCKPCARRWGRQKQPSCPLCRARASQRKFSTSAITIDKTLAASIERRHPQRYLDALKLHRQLSQEETDREALAQTTAPMPCLDLPLCVNYPDLERRIARHYGYADTFKGNFSFRETVHLNALALALTTPRRLMLVRRNDDEYQGVRARLVEVNWGKGRRVSFSNQMDALAALVEKRDRSRSGVVTIKLRAYHGPALALRETRETRSTAGLLRLQCHSWADEAANYARLGRVQQRCVPARRQQPPSFLEEMAEDINRIFSIFDD